MIVRPEPVVMLRELTSDPMKLIGAGARPFRWAMPPASTRGIGKGVQNRQRSVDILYSVYRVAHVDGVCGHAVADQGGGYACGQHVDRGTTCARVHRDTTGIGELVIDRSRGGQTRDRAVGAAVGTDVGVEGRRPIRAIRAVVDRERRIIRRVLDGQNPPNALDAAGIAHVDRIGAPQGGVIVAE